MKHLKPKTPPACDLCKDYGIVARRVNTGAYVCAGPVPEDARRVYEDFCGCEEGEQMRNRRSHAECLAAEAKQGAPS